MENIHRVTLVGEIHGDSTVKDGTDYRINLNDQHYDYEITAQMNGQNVTAEKKTDTNGEIYYNIGNVTGDLNVTATRTPKTYTITTDGTGKEDLTAAGSATYLQDYTFTVEIWLHLPCDREEKWGRLPGKYGCRPEDLYHRRNQCDW